MIYLLDVNALIALGHIDHTFHARVSRWLGSLQRPILATCSITELGFVRILAHSSAYRLSLAGARDLLISLKQSKAYPFHFFADHNDISQLPEWVETARQVTDGHLLGLAATHGAKLATLDRGIPGAFLIPS